MSLARGTNVNSVVILEMPKPKRLTEFFYYKDCTYFLHSITFTRTLTKK